jgi:hypothetical protein
VALSKTDLYPEWRRIAELDRAHLERIGLTDSLVPIASPLRDAALVQGDASLNGESGFPQFLGAVRDRVMTTDREQVRALDDLRAALDMLDDRAASRREQLADPEEARRRMAELEEARSRLTLMRETSSRWMVALNDGMADVRTEADYRLRTTMRSHLQEMDRALAEAKPKSDWEDLTGELRAKLSEEADGIFDGIRAGIDQLAGRLAEMIAEDVPDALFEEGVAFSATELWESGERELTGESPGPLSSALSVLRGGYSGMLMLGMLGQLAGLAALAPVTIGVGALFGVRQFREERKRQLEKQRQEARGVVRQFIDQVQLELANRVQRAVQDGHRSLRDHFGTRIQELAAMATESVKTMQEAASADEAQRRRLIGSLDEQIGELAALRSRIDAIDRGPQ